MCLSEFEDILDPPYSPIGIIMLGINIISYVNKNLYIIRCVFGEKIMIENLAFIQEETYYTSISRLTFRFLKPLHCTPYQMLILDIYNTAENNIDQELIQI